MSERGTVGGEGLEQAKKESLDRERVRLLLWPSYWGEFREGEKHQRLLIDREKKLTIFSSNKKCSSVDAKLKRK